jgi:hypothetical protein
VHHGVYPVVPYHLSDRLSISDVSPYERDVTKSGGMTELHGVDDDNVSATLSQQSDCV